MDNRKFILSLKKGNEASFKEAYLNYYDKLVNIAKRFNFTVLTPQDFVQETFLRLYNKRELLNEDVLLDKQFQKIKFHYKFGSKNKFLLKNMSSTYVLFRLL